MIPAKVWKAESSALASPDTPEFQGLSIAFFKKVGVPTSSFGCFMIVSPLQLFSESSHPLA